MIAAEETYAAPDTPGWREIPWDDEVKWLELPSAGIRYVDLGEGDKPALVLIHGIGGCWQNWLQAIPRLATRRRVIAFDLPGFGSSPLPQERLTLAFYARTVEALAGALELGPTVLVGNSLGGLISVETAATYPDRVERVVLVAPAGVSVAQLPHSLKLLCQLSAIRSAQTVGVLRRVPGFSAHPMSPVVHEPAAFERGLLRAAFRPGGGTPGFVHALPTLIDPRLPSHLRRQLGAVAAPALVVWGRDDRINPLADAQTFLAGLGTAELAVIEGCGHTPMLEHPRTFNDLVLEFVTR